MRISGLVRWKSTFLLLLFIGLPTELASVNSIQAENAKAGTSDWRLVNQGRASRVIEGYASAVSVNRGGQIRLFVNTSAPSYTMDVYRLGYYGGSGARRMLPTITRSATTQPACPQDPTTGLIECNWGNPYVLNIPNSSDPTDWMSGIYVVKLTASTGPQQYIQFAVRDDARFTDVLMQQAVATYQAYNVWGGKSLYGTIANRSDTANKAEKVSFNRPYDGDQGNGVADLFMWEYPMLFWLEKEGYDVSYATSVDVDADPNLLISHKVFMSVGHDEYWSWNMRDNVEGARDRGVSLAFFSGNTSYWQVRFEPSLVTGDQGRTMVGYKEHWRQDPITPDKFKTTRWRDAPVSRPEDAMMGVRFVTQARPPFVVEDASHWVLTGTGLKNGDVLTNPDGTSFLGYEVDAMGPQSPANTQRLAHSPANSRHANFSDMTVYRAASGSTVFDSGSISWSHTLPQTQQITRNVLARTINGSFSDAPPVRPLLPTPLASQDIGDVGRAGFVALSGAKSFTLNGAGQNAFAGRDALFYAYQPVSGDAQIVARLKSLQNFWDNRAGVMIRESLAADAKSVSLLGRPSESAGVLQEGVEFTVKNAAGAKPATIASRDSALPNWLKLTRSGNTFTSYVSTDGVAWTLVGSATVAMATDVYIGAEVQSAQRGVWATASFDEVTVTGGTPPATCQDPNASNIGQPLPCGYPPPSGSACASVTLSKTSFYSGANESNWTVNVTAPTTSCTWSVVSDSSWIVIGSTIPAPPAGSGSFKVKTETNAGPFRTGHFTIAGAVYTVKQEEGEVTPPPNAPPPTASLAASPSTIASGSHSTLTWTTTNATTVSLSPGIGATTVSGSIAVSPTATTTYTVTATGAGGTTTASTTVTVTVTPPPADGPACSSVVLDKLSYYSGAGAVGQTSAANWKIFVTAPTTTCTWTAVSDSSWLVVRSTTPTPAAGSGYASVRTLVNTGPERIGHFTIGGVIYTVTQEPAPGF